MQYQKPEMTDDRYSVCSTFGQFRGRVPNAINSAISLRSDWVEQPSPSSLAIIFDRITAEAGVE